MTIRSEDIAIKVESCQKSRRILVFFFAIPNFRGGPSENGTHIITSALRHVDWKKFREDTPTSPAVIVAHTLNFRPNFKFLLLITVRRYALQGLSYRNSVRLSICLSVRLSVTLVHCVHMVRPTIVISSPYDSPIILVSGGFTTIPKFEEGHPERGR